MLRIVLNPAIILILLFMVPPDVTVRAGPLNFPIYRLYLLVVTPLCLIKYLGIKKNPVDFLILAYVLSGAAALAYNHGTSEWQYAGILFVETVTPFLLARIFISDRSRFEDFVRLYFALVLIILPFAIYESLTGDHLLRDVARKAMGYGPLGGRPARMGLERAYGPFEHPIHYGFFCSVIFGLVVATTKSVGNLVFRWAAISVAVFVSLSSGPLLSFMLQNMLKSWDLGTRWLAYRWRILAMIFAVLYVVIDLVSNRTPFHVLVSYGTFRLASAYNRIHIWNYGSASVAKHPIFGIGLNEWERAPWMSSSMDNFWLLTAVRYGLPTLFLLSLALGLLFVQLGRKNVSGDVADYRKGWCISLVALIIAGCTVHFWTALYCLFFMMVGSSVWIVNAPESASQADDADSPADRVSAGDAPLPARAKPAYSRFPGSRVRHAIRSGPGLTYSRNLSARPRAETNT